MNDRLCRTGNIITTTYLHTRCSKFHATFKTLFFFYKTCLTLKYMSVFKHVHLHDHSLTWLPESLNSFTVQQREVWRKPRRCVYCAHLLIFGALHRTLKRRLNICNAFPCIIMQQSKMQKKIDPVCYVLFTARSSAYAVSGCKYITDTLIGKYVEGKCNVGRYLVTWPDGLGRN
jgi:hypothetical protein